MDILTWKRRCGNGDVGLKLGQHDLQAGISPPHPVERCRPRIIGRVHKDPDIYCEVLTEMPPSEWRSPLAPRPHLLEGYGRHLVEQPLQALCVRERHHVRLGGQDLAQLEVEALEVAQNLKDLAGGSLMPGSPQGFGAPGALRSLGTVGP